MSQGFRFQSATVLVNTSITKSLAIVLSKCLLLVQFCLAHVFSPTVEQQRKPYGSLCYFTDATNFQTCDCWPLWSWAYQGQILPLSAHFLLHILLYGNSQLHEYSIPIGQSDLPLQAVKFDIWSWFKGGFPFSFLSCNLLFAIAFLITHAQCSLAHTCRSAWLQK